MTYPAPDVLPYDEWFDSKPHPHDSMPIATDSPITDDVEYDNKYADPEKLSELESMNPRPEEEIADDITMHERMYKIATAKYNPFAVGGSENLGGSKK